MSDSEDALPTPPAHVYGSIPSSTVASALTLAASQPSSPLSSLTKELEVSPLDEAGMMIAQQQQAKEEGGSTPPPEEVSTPPAETPVETPARTSPTPTENTTPDGGAFVAWAQVAAAFLFNGIGWGTLSMYGVFQLYYLDTLGLPLSTISWISSVQTFLTYIMTVVSGRLADNGYCYSAAVVGTTLITGASIWMSFCTGPGSLFASQGVITGIGLGLLTAPALPSISAYFATDGPRGSQRAVALAISTVGSSVGGAILPAVIQYLLPVIGFGWAVRCCALLSLVICVSATLLIRPPPASSQGKEKPVDPRPVWRQLLDWSAFRQPPMFFFTLSTFFMFWATYFGFYYITTYAENVIGLSTNTATLLLILTTAMAAPSRVPSGIVADRYMSALDLLIIMLALMGTVLLTWLAVGTSVPGVYAFAIMMGLIYGATQGAWLPAMAELLPEEVGPESPENSEKDEANENATPKPPAANIGSCFGMISALGAFATLAGSPTAAAIIDGAGDGYSASDYSGAIAWAGTVTMFSAVLAGVSRVYAKGWGFKAAHRAKTAKKATTSAV